MPQIVSCPDCGRKLRVPDHLLGKNVKCPGCGQKFPAEAAEAPEEEPAPARARRDSAAYKTADDDAPKSRGRRTEPVDEDYPVSKRRRDDDDDDRGGAVVSKADIRQGWERVRLGVNLVIIANWVIVGSVILYFSVMLLIFLFLGASLANMVGTASSGGPPQQQAGALGGEAAGTFVAAGVGVCLMWVLLILLVLVYYGVRLTGEGFCMGVAPTMKTKVLKGLAIAAFCAGIANLLLPWVSAGGSFALARYGGGCVGFGGWGLTGMLALAEFVCFGIFLRGVASVMKKDGLAMNVIIHMIGTIIWFVAMPVLAFIFILVSGAAMFTSIASSAGSNNPSAVAGNAAGTSAAILVGGVVCWALVLLIGLALFIWYFVLLYQVRGTVDRWLDRN
jgi:hypothetical protein